MPIPQPTAGQSESEFVSECIREIIDEYGQEQSAAICYDTYRKGSNMTAQQKIASKFREIQYKGINLFAEEGGLEDACWEGYVAIGMKDLGGKSVPNCVPIAEEASKVQMEKGYQFAEGESYPWDECIADQTARYGDEETAAKVCGYIKAQS